jgi:hypothetical protein
MAVLITYIFFQRGMFMISNLFNNDLLKVSTIVLIAANILLTIYDIISLSHTPEERVVFLVIASVMMGVTGIVYGLSLRRLEKHLGRAAEVAGIFEIVAALFFITVVFALVGSFVLIPAELFEIIIIFKAIEVVKARELNTAVV